MGCRGAGEPALFSAGNRPSTAKNRAHPCMGLRNSGIARGNLQKFGAGWLQDCPAF